MGPIPQTYRPPKTHYSERGYLGSAVCGTPNAVYVTGYEYQVDCERCERILDARSINAEKEWGDC